MTLGIRYAARSDVGMLREGNEDSAYAGARLIAVADGMGGHVGGEIASAAAINTLRKLDTDVPAHELLAALEHAVKEANSKLHSIVESEPALQGMGTTLTAMLWSGSHIALVHIGDSRAYLLRNGELFQITHDHTLVQSLVDEGRISLDEAASHPQRSLLLRALDGRGEVDPDLALREAQVGDRYLLCSDGLSGVVSADTIHQVLSAQPDPEAAIRQLIDLANRGGGPDNITCVVADVIDLSMQPPPGGRPVLAGAAAHSSAPPGSPPVRAGDTPAQRAAEFRDTLPQPAVGMDGLPPAGPAPMHAAAVPLGAPPQHGAVMAPPLGPPPLGAMGPADRRPPRAKARWTWLIVAVAMFMVVVGGGAFIGYQALTSGFYISAGKSGADKDHVVIYQGNPSGGIPGLDLSQKANRQPMAPIIISDLPVDEQARVKATFLAGDSPDGALAKAEILRGQLCKYVLHTIPPQNEEVAIFHGEGQQRCPQVSPIQATPPVKLSELPAAKVEPLAKGGVTVPSAADAKSELDSLAKIAADCQKQAGMNGCPAPTKKPGR